MISPETINPILIDCTTVYRKGPAITESRPGLLADTIAAQERGEPLPGGVIEIFGYPPVSDMPPHEQAVDMEFVVVGVDTASAEANRSKIMHALGDGTLPESGKTLTDGPSYIHLGADLGSQDMALRLMALGSVLNLWTITTPRDLGITDEKQHRDMIGAGCIYAIGWNQTAANLWNAGAS